MKSLAINAHGNAITSFAKELNPTGVGEYIYIVIHTHTQTHTHIYIYIYIYNIWVLDISFFKCMFSVFICRCIFPLIIHWYLIYHKVYWFFFTLGHCACVYVCVCLCVCKEEKRKIKATLAEKRSQNLKNKKGGTTTPSGRSPLHKLKTNQNHQRFF